MDEGATDAREADGRILAVVARQVDEAEGIVAISPAMRQVVEMVRRVAQADSTLLITGESGSGKERIARSIHAQSPRAAGPFIAVNCGAISEGLLESELFGHVRGAFTGASHDRLGLFEASNHGTLLLDEIGDIPPALQVKLLRVLQQREVRRVGDNKTRPIDGRVLAATNRDLADRVAQGLFRQDLYYRIKVVDIRVPALRERTGDLLALAQMALAEAAVRAKRQVTGLTLAAAEQLGRYDWPGNVRELENAMERAVVLGVGSRVELSDLPEEVRQASRAPPSAPGTTRRLEDVIKEHILAALELNRGKQSQTAQQLGIGSATLYRKLKSYGLIKGRAGASRSS